MSLIKSTSMTDLTAGFTNVDLSEQRLSVALNEEVDRRADETKKRTLAEKVEKERLEQIELLKLVTEKKDFMESYVMLKISQLTKLCIKKATKLHVYSIEGVDNDDLESFNTAIELISTKQPLIDYLWDIETIEEQNSNKKTLELCNSAKALAKHDTEMKLIQSQVSQLQNYKTMVDRFNANSDNKKLETDINIESKHQSKSLLKQSTMLSE